MPSTTQQDTGIAIELRGFAVDPQYVDTTRDLATWDASLGGAGGEYAGFLRLWADTTLIDDAIAYIRDGFAPQNAALNNTAHDGGDVGAVAAVVGAATVPPIIASYRRRRAG
jgi:hypothetical protein